MGRIGEHVNYLSHGGPGRALVFDTHHCDLEHIDDTCEWVPSEPGVDHCQNGGCIRRLRYLGGRFPDPSHDVHPLPELSHRLPPRDQLQQHHTEAVHVALLVYFQSVGVLC